MQECQYSSLNINPSILQYRRQDAALASSLVTILQESEQEVPDFVKDCATGGSSGFAQSHDIRGGQSVVSNAANDADDGW